MALQRFLHIPKDDNHPLLMDMTASVIHSPAQGGSSVNSVSLGGIRPEWIQNKTSEEKQQHPLKWFPRVIDGAPPEKYYALERNVIGVVG
ncbi:MAG: hypothetical protein SGARI_001154 [Bacillariaceae sp.]